MKTVKSFFTLASLALLQTLLVANATAATVTEDEYLIFYTHDMLGSPVAVSDDKGRVLWYENTEPFGKSLGRVSQSGEQFPDSDKTDTHSRVGYTGHEYDLNTDLVYMKARFYDADIGRFYSLDPVGYTTQNPSQSFNRYLYANNNPYVYTDPDGEYAETKFDVAQTIYQIGQFFSSWAETSQALDSGDAQAAHDAYVVHIERRTDLGLSLLGIALPVPSYALIAGKNAAKVTKGVDPKIYRMGANKESKTRLGKKAQEAEDEIGTHGVSGSTTKPNAPCSSASCSSLEAAGFNVKPTPTRRDPNHVTIELPKPVTKEVADKFNNVFGR